MTGSRFRLPFVAMSAAVGAVIAAAVVLARPEALIGAEFRQALASSRTTAVAVEPGADRPYFDAQAFDTRHLRQSSLKSPAKLPVLGPLKVGQRLTIAGDGGEQVLEVVDVRTVPPTIAGTARDLAAGNLVVVTLRAEDEAGTTVRMLVEEPAAAMVQPGVHRRAL